MINIDKFLLCILYLKVKLLHYTYRKIIYKQIIYK